MKSLNILNDRKIIFRTKLRASCNTLDVDFPTSIDAHGVTNNNRFS